MTSPEYQAPTWVNDDDPGFVEGVSPDLGAGYLNQLSGAVEDHGQRLGAITPVVTYLNANAVTQDAGDNRYILQDNAVGFAPAEATANALAGKQPLDADLTAIAGLDSATAGTVGTDGAGWVKKTYAQLKTALGLVKGDVGLGNVDNTSDAAKPISTATQTALNAKADTNSLGTAVGLIILGASNGTNDSTAINALLSNPGGGPRRVVARPGETYHLGAPLVVPSGTVLDLTGATIVLNAGLTSANMVRNTAYTPTATGTGSITSGSPTLTTALASSAVIGQTVIVAGANSNNQVLTALITAIGSGTVTLDTPAGATVSAAAVSLHTRDHDIAIIGGYWQRGSSTAVGNSVGEHTILLRHIDGLLVTGQRFATTSNGKYCVAAGDVTDFVIEHQHFEQTHSDGVHINGPARNGRIAYLSGTTGDDMASITAADWTAYNDTQGDVEHLVIEHMQITDGGQRGVQILPGINAAIRHLLIRDIHGTTTFQPGVQLADDSEYGFPHLGGGTLEDVTIEHIRMARNNQSGAPINIQATVVDQLCIRDVFVDMPTANPFITPVVDFDPATPGAYGLVRISDLRVVSTGQNPLVFVRQNASIDTLVLSDAHVVDESLWKGIRIDGVVTDLTVRGLTGQGGNGWTGVLLDVTAANARVDRLTVSDVHVDGTVSGQLVAATEATHTLGHVDISNCSLADVYWYADLNTATKLTVSGSSATGGGGLLHAGANAVVTLRSAACDVAGATFVNIAAGGVVRYPERARSARFYSSFLNQTIPSGAPTMVWMATTEFNDDPVLYTLNGNAVTVHEPGLYEAIWALTLNGGTAGERSSTVRVNGADRAEAAGYGNSKLGLSGAAPLRLAANDVVTLSSYVTGGTDVSVVDSDSWKTGLSLIRIGD